MKASEGQVALLKSYFLEYPLFFQKRKNSQLLEVIGKSYIFIHLCSAIRDFFDKAIQVGIIACWRVLLSNSSSIKGTEK